MTEGMFGSAPVVLVYTRNQAISDGVLVPVPENDAFMAGFRAPVVITETIHQRINAMIEKELTAKERKDTEVVEHAKHDYINNVLMTAHLAVYQAGMNPETRNNHQATFDWYGEPVHCHIGPDDDLKPCFTIMATGDM